MKVKELIEKLQEVDQDLDVRIWAEHGQHDMMVDDASIQYSYYSPDEYMIEASYCAGEYEEETEEDISTAYKFVSIY